jgi:hypothetical protein
MNIWIKLVSGAILVLLVAAVFYFVKNNKSDEAIFIPDTNIIVRYEKELKRDTVYKFTDKVVYKKSEPEKIYIQRADTVFINRINSFDLPIRIEKRGDVLNVKAVNIKDSVLKEYVFRDMSRDFVLNSVNRNLLLKSKNYYFEKPLFSFSLNYPLSEKSTYPEYTLGLESGLSYREKMFLTAGIKYGTKEEKLKLGISLKYKPF